MSVSVRVPEALYNKAVEIAAAQHVSVDEVFASAFTDQLAAWERLGRRVARGNREEFLRVLDQAPVGPGARCRAGRIRPALIGLTSPFDIKPRNGGRDGGQMRLAGQNDIGEVEELACHGGGLVVGTIQFAVDRKNGYDHLGEVDLRASHGGGPRWRHEVVRQHRRRCGIPMREAVRLPTPLAEAGFEDVKLTATVGSPIFPTRVESIPEFRG
jgi:hypothetical protein